MTAFPYPYGSDLHWLHGWGYRVGTMLDEREERTEYDWMVFRPDELADNAMMRFSIDYPAVIAELRTKLQGTEDAFNEFKAKRGKASSAILSDWMEVLQSRIIKAAELIAEREGIKPHSDSVPALKIRSRSRTPLDEIIFPVGSKTTLTSTDEKTDTKTKKPKRPPSDPTTVKAITAVNKHRKKVADGKAVYRSLHDILAELLGHKGESEVARIERALRPSRHGDQLLPDIVPDN